jgi:hypothetical protein
MPSYKGKNLPDGKIQIRQDGKEFAIVNTLEEAKALIKGLGMRLEAPPVPPPVSDELAKNKSSNTTFDAVTFVLFVIGFLVVALLFLITVSEMPKFKDQPKQNQIKIPIAGKDEIKIKQFDLEITLSDFTKHVFVEKDGRGETTLYYNINVKNGSETKVENFSVGNGRHDGSGVSVTFSDEFGNDVKTWTEEQKNFLRLDLSTSPWRIRPGDLKTRAMFTEGAILKAKRLNGILGFRSVSRVPFIVDLEILPLGPNK